MILNILNLDEKNSLKKKVQPFMQQKGRQLRRITQLFSKVLSYLSGGM